MRSALGHRLSSGRWRVTSPLLTQSQSIRKHNTARLLCPLNLSNLEANLDHTIIRPACTPAVRLDALISLVFPVSLLEHLFHLPRFAPPPHVAAGRCPRMPRPRADMPLDP